MALETGRSTFSDFERYEPSGAAVAGFLTSVLVNEDGEKIGLIAFQLNLPKKDGREVLAEIKTDPDLHRIPMIVLTTSEAEEDILKAYDLNANGYVTKPADFDQFIDAVRSLHDFWRTIVKLLPE